MHRSTSAEGPAPFVTIPAQKSTRKETAQGARTFFAGLPEV
jgi:hypothetical protein